MECGFVLVEWMCRPWRTKVEVEGQDGHHHAKYSEGRQAVRLCPDFAGREPEEEMAREQKCIARPLHRLPDDFDLVGAHEAPSATIKVVDVARPASVGT